MKKLSVVFVVLSLLIISILAQDKLYVFKVDKTIVAKYISAVDSIFFSESDTKLNIRNTDKTETSILISEIDSIKFLNTETIVRVNYDGETATVTNPYEGAGVAVTINGAAVTVNSILSNTEVSYLLTGTTTNGMFKIYSSSNFELQLTNVYITNPTGPAINIQSKYKANILLANETSNTLNDGSSYTTSTEDQKSTLFSEGGVEIFGNGTLTVKSEAKHAICSDDFICISGGNINIPSAGKDGIHSKGLFRCNGGIIQTNTTGDGIDCELGNLIVLDGTITTTNTVADTKGISCDYDMTIAGGYISQTVSGSQAKGLKSKLGMNITGGVLKINTSGNVVLNALTVGFDPAYCTAIKCDSSITISNSDIEIIATGTGAKGISAGKNIGVEQSKIKISVSGAGATYTNASNVIDSYNSTCMTADGNINIVMGTLNFTATSTATGGKGISASGTITFGDATNVPVVNLTTAGARFLVSGTDYCHPKTLLADKAITINNGTLVLNSTDDGIHSEASVAINGGNTTVSAISSTQGVGEGVEAPLIYFNGGTTSITASNDGVNATYGTKVGGTESNDNSHFYITGGTHYINATAGDAIDSNGNITMTGGTVFANGPTSGVEEAVDFNGTFNMNGGVFVGAGSSSNMTKAMNTSSTQPNMYISSSAVISSSTMMTVAINGVGVVSFKPKTGGYKFLVSTPQMTKGAGYVIYTGGTYTGGTSTNNFYSGGTFSNSGATSKKSGTLSTSNTVNTISF